MPLPSGQDFEDNFKARGGDDVNLLYAVREPLDLYTPTASPTTRAWHVTTVIAACARPLREKQTSNVAFTPADQILFATWKFAVAELKALLPLLRGSRWGKVKRRLLPKTSNAQRFHAVQRLAHLAPPPVDEQAGGVKAKVLRDANWIEVFDPRHRPAHAMQTWYRQWLSWVDPESPEYDPNYGASFFQFADGASRVQANVMLSDLTYLESEIARQPHEVLIKGKTLVWRAPRGATRLLSTAGMRSNNAFRPNQANGWGIWVMSPEKRLFGGSPFDTNTNKVQFHHSSFLGGGAILCGGEWKADKGRLQVISMESGHYQPTVAQFRAALGEMAAMGLDLNEVAVEWWVAGGAGRTCLYYNGAEFMQPGMKWEYNAKPTRIADRAIRRVNPGNPRATVADSAPLVVFS